MNEETTTTECEIPKEILLSLTTLVMTDGAAWLRVKHVDGKYVLETLGRSGTHCPTCQCRNVSSERPSHPMHSEIKREKPWHHG